MIYNITNIAYEQIKGDYHWAKYGEFKVIMDIKTGYINATKLCSLATTNNGTKKQFGMWRQNKSANSIMYEASQRIGCPITDLLIVVAGGHCNEVRGTYAHPELIPHILYWANAKFADAVMSIINQFIVERELNRRSITVQSNNLSIQLKAKADMRDVLVNATLPSDKELQCVYFIKSGEFTKIGYTSNLPKRLQSLQVGNPVQLVLVYSILSRYAEQVEADLHLLFADYSIGGEWFKLSEDAINSVKAIYDA